MITYFLNKNSKLEILEISVRNANWSHSDLFQEECCY